MMSERALKLTEKKSSTKESDTSRDSRIEFFPKGIDPVLEHD